MVILILLILDKIGIHSSLRALGSFISLIISKMKAKSNSIDDKNTHKSSIFISGISSFHAMDPKFNSPETYFKIEAHNFCFESRFNSEFSLIRLMKIVINNKNLSYSSNKQL